MSKNDWSMSVGFILVCTLLQLGDQFTYANTVLATIVMTMTTILFEIVFTAIKERRNAK